MKLEKIITLANSKTKIAFTAMERSLRATKCDLPIWVIPYDDTYFDLPAGSFWWPIPAIIDWLDMHGAHPMMRKYQCLTTSNYQYVDTDICFLLNPEEVLLNKTDFVSSCGHWHNPNETVTEQSRKMLLEKSTVWQSSIFNAGQFACDRILYSVNDLIEVASCPNIMNTSLHFKWHDQPGLNLLVNMSNITIHNLTLPPYRMESTWAGDYLSEFNTYWHIIHKKPYLIHWAGGQLDIERPINELFFKHLTDDEKLTWKNERVDKSITLAKRFFTQLGRVIRLVKKI